MRFKLNLPTGDVGVKCRGSQMPWGGRPRTQGVRRRGGLSLCRQAEQLQKVRRRHAKRFAGGLAQVLAPPFRVAAGTNAKSQVFSGSLL